MRSGAALVLPAVSFALFLAGCANPLQSPPEAWSVAKPSTGCPAIEGAWDNVGPTSGRFGAALSWFVMPSDDAATRKHLEGAYRIEIAGDPARGLEVSAWRRNAFVARRTLEAGRDYECEAGELVLSLPAEGTSRLRGAALMRATDGALLARTSSVEVGLKYFVLPYAIPSRIWARFEAQASR